MYPSKGGGALTELKAFDDDDEREKKKGRGKKISSKEMREKRIVFLKSVTKVM